MNKRLKADIVSCLLRKNLSVAQLLGFLLANLTGMAIVVAGLQFYLDLRPIWQKSDSFLKKDYLVINKRVDLTNTFGKATSFSPEEISELEQQPWVNGVGTFSTSDFHVSARMTQSNGRTLSSYMFFESLPRQYVDTEGIPWVYSPGQETVPIIMSRDYLALYNFGFASGAGLPQISEGVISSIPLELQITSDDGTRTINMHARIAGFSNRLNTILVPQEFLDWANATYGSGKPKQPSRLIIDVNSPGDKAIKPFLSQHGYESAGDKSASQASYLLNVAAGVVIGIGIIISLLSFFILLLSISLLMQKNHAKIRSLILLGYPLRQVAAPYCRIVCIINLIVMALAISAMTGARAAYLNAVEALGGGAAIWWSAATAVILSVVIAGINIVAINRRVRAAFHQKQL